MPQENRPARTRPDLRIVLRYTLLQLPALGLLIVALLAIRNWFDLSWGWIGAIIGIWVLKDLTLFPLVWRAYDPEPRPHGNSLVGHTGRIVRDLDPDGTVEIHGELWRARLAEESLQGRAGDLVRVTAMVGLTLEVEVFSRNETKEAV